MESKAEKKPLMNKKKKKLAKKKTSEEKASEKVEKSIEPYKESVMLTALSSASSTTEKNKLTLKLLIDTESNKVLFAEAGKDVVDFLLSLLGMPVASIVKILSKNRMVGSIANLHKSLEDLDVTYLDPKLNRAAALSPVVSSPCFSRATLLLPKPKPEKRYYTCHKSYCSAYNVTDDNTAMCPSCFLPMTLTMTFVDPKTGKKVEANAQGGGGFVKGVVTYIIMDDLTVIPMSTISTITLLDKLGVKDMASLQEKPAELGFKEGVELLKASLYLTTVLTQVFLVKQK